MSEWAKQQGESETWLCNLPVPPTACIAPGTSPRLPPLLSSQPAFISVHCKGLRGGAAFSAAGSVRDTTNTEIAGCQRADLGRK